MNEKEIKFTKEDVREFLNQFDNNNGLDEEGKKRLYTLMDKMVDVFWESFCKEEEKVLKTVLFQTLVHSLVDSEESLKQGVVL